MSQKFAYRMFYLLPLEQNWTGLIQTLIQIHFPRFMLVFYSQLEEILKVIMSAVACARLFILDQIH